MGGRGAGKTRAGAEWVRAKALGREPLGEVGAVRIALVGETIAEVRRVIIVGVSGLLGVHGDHERPRFEPSKFQLVWPSGAIAQMFWPRPRGLARAAVRCRLVRRDRHMAPAAATPGTCCMFALQARAADPHDGGDDDAAADRRF